VPYFLCVPGIYADKNGWQVYWANALRARGYAADHHYYRSSWMRFQTQGKAIAEVAALIRKANHDLQLHPVNLIAHSNGTVVGLEALFQNPDLHIDDLHLFGSAAYRDCNRNHVNMLLTSGRVERCYIYTSQGDGVLLAGNLFTGWLQNNGWGYGDLGRRGPTNLLNTNKPDVMVIDCTPADHGDCVYKYADRFIDRVCEFRVASGVYNTKAERASA
jgi:pimeloyl-ACP methyl ester carboxylesterase